MKKRVADIIMEELIKHDVTTCFGVVGGGAMFLDNALLHCKKMKKIFNHHEQASAMAAEAYARYSGKMAAVCVTSGPGATNTLTGVMGAWQDSIPMIVLSGQVRYAISVPQSGLNLRYRGIQEYQIVPAVKHMTKYAVMITDPLSIKREIDKAINIALDGRRGPVWLDIPQDMQSAVVEEEECYSIELFESEVPEPKEEEVKSVIEWLKQADRPCVLLGTGIRSSNSYEEFYRFAEKIRVPMIGASWAADCCYDECPGYYGLSGNVGPRAGNFILQNADVILVLGNSLGFRQTGFNLEGFVPKAKIIMVDACQDEARKPGLRIHQFIHADLKRFFNMVCSINISVQAVDAWFRYCEDLRNRFTVFEGAEGKKPNDAVSSYLFWKVFRKYEPEDSILALGNNTANTAKLQIGIQKKEQRVLTNYTCGSMGYDLPAAEGASVVSGKKVYCVTGDGSIMMNLQELETIRHYDLPISIVVFSNDGYGAIRQTSKNFFDGEYIGCTPDTGVGFPNFRDVANTFGFEYRLCTTNGELDESIEYFVNSSERVLLEVRQAFDDPVIPKVMSRIDENGQMLSPVLQDMYPFLDRKDYDVLMIQ
ncbi:MAG: thiamine pyrophosphate-binding protein [Lachnospiraceae bacterium]|nr:thiamine pyrophosphate-binding protein [Lachnospiraceae bacterium]